MLMAERQEPLPLAVPTCSVTPPPRIGTLMDVPSAHPPLAAPTCSATPRPRTAIPMVTLPVHPPLAAPTCSATPRLSKGVTPEAVSGHGNTIIS